MKFFAAVAASLLSTAVAGGVRGDVPRVVSPEVHGDHSVSFRVYAPNAKQVLLSLESAPTLPLHQDGTGVWSVTTSPLEADYYNYGFVIDGLGFSDPGNPITRPNLFWPASILHVPGSADLLWEQSDVPHGELHHHFYHSAIGGDDRDYWVYTPPGYAPGNNRRYPTLYLLHGFSDDASAWTVVGRANVILDNLIARHRAKPMVVVMPLGYGSRKILKIGRQSGGNMHSGGDAPVAENARLFQAELFAEVIPRIEQEYAVSGARDDHAIAGSSMGGGESLQTGLNHADRFAWVGSFSAGGLTGDIPGMFPDAGREVGRHPLKMLLIACGREDSLYPATQQLHQYFTSLGIPDVELTTPGAHDWQVWRRNLGVFLQGLFR